MTILSEVDKRLSELRKDLYRVFEYTDVGDVMDEIHQAIDEIESVQDLLLELEIEE